jgi:hypothetical protein
MLLLVSRENVEYTQPAPLLHGTRSFDTTKLSPNESDGNPFAERDIRRTKKIQTLAFFVLIFIPFCCEIKKSNYFLKLTYQSKHQQKIAFSFCNRPILFLISRHLHCDPSPLRPISLACQKPFPSEWKNIHDEKST